MAGKFQCLASNSLTAAQAATHKENPVYAKTPFNHKTLRGARRIASRRFASHVRLRADQTSGKIASQVGGSRRASPRPATTHQPNIFAHQARPRARVAGVP